MEFRDIEYFAVLAQHRHVGRAAEALGLSQPALSLSLRRLENSLRTKLVKRTPKGVELTVTGTALLSRVQRLRLAREDIQREVADLSQGRAGYLYVGAHPGVATDPLAPACAALLKDAPNLELMVTVMTSQLLPALRVGELDLIVHELPASPQEDLMHEHLFDDPFVIFAAQNHRLAKRKRVTLDDIAQERWARSGAGSEHWESFTRMLVSTGNAAPRVGIRTDSLALRDHLVAGSNLLGFTTRRGFKQIAPRFHFAEFPVKEMSQVRRVGVSYRKDGYLSPVARRLLEILKVTAKETAGEA